jgi:predicted Rossmann fold flavoprotein
MPDVAVEVTGPGVERDRARRRGSFLFTHFGLSGPVVMDVSRAVTASRAPQQLALVCDFFPEQTEDELAAVIGQRCREQGRMQVGTTLTTWLPRRLVDAMLPLAGIAAETRGADLSRAALAKLTHNLHALSLPVHGTLGFAKAEVTAGGIALDEIDSRTMESKRVPGLFAIGEILDLDGPIGGYNFQCAFSTGFLAGESV